MRTRHVLAALTVLALSPSNLPATDLTQIDRTIRKEPVYQTKAPKYCLLVFGPAAATRVWLVVDGNTLYVDRNGNGDLTEDGEKVKADELKDAEEGVHVFTVGELRDGDRTHKSLRVGVTTLDHLTELDKRVKALLTKEPKARGYWVILDLDLPGRKGAGVGGRVTQQSAPVDVNGVLQFGSTPKDAPILHFGGPLQITLFDPCSLKIGRDTDVVLGVGCAGVGPGTTTYMDYDGVIPENAYPTLDVTYPTKQPGEPPARERFELKQRC
jgi:hypothetical protein